MYIKIVINILHIDYEIVTNHTLKNLGNQFPLLLKIAILKDFDLCAMWFRGKN